MKLDKGISLDISYKWKDYGRVKSKQYSKHDISLGLRLDM